MHAPRNRHANSPTSFLKTPPPAPTNSTRLSPRMPRTGVLSAWPPSTAPSCASPLCGNPHHRTPAKVVINEAVEPAKKSLDRSGAAFHKRHPGRRRKILRGKAQTRSSNCNPLLARLFRGGEFLSQQSNDKLTTTSRERLCTCDRVFSASPPVSVSRNKPAASARSPKRATSPIRFVQIQLDPIQILASRHSPIEHMSHFRIAEMLNRSFFLSRS